MIEIINADCRAAMREMPAESVQCVVTSPPYWGLRDYGLEGVVWDGDADCEHEWGEKQPLASNSGLHRMPANQTGGDKDYSSRADNRGAFCRLCGAWRGCLGLEPTVDLFVEHLVAVFREVWRVLRPDGVLFLNLGDSYSAGKPLRDEDLVAGRGGKPRNPGQSELRSPGLKPKDLIGVPWRVAFALQADGWWLRSAIVWAKGLSFCPTYAGSVMPESCTDRPTSAYEHVFLLTKSARYYYDADAVREGFVDARMGNPGSPSPKAGRIPGQSAHTMASAAWESSAAGRNLRNVWAINPQPFPDAHFATFPEALVEPCIKAGSSPQACGSCGAPWERVVDEATGRSKGQAWLDHEHDAERGAAKSASSRGYMPGRTTGWRPTCECSGPDYVPGAGRCVVLDPFGGSGTVGLVAKRLGRDAILIDASAEYCDMARKRTGKDVTAELFT